MNFSNLKLSEQQREWETSLRHSGICAASPEETMAGDQYLCKLLCEPDIFSPLKIPVPSLKENCFSFRVLNADNTNTNTNTNTSLLPPPRSVLPENAIEIDLTEQQVQATWSGDKASGSEWLRFNADLVYGESSMDEDIFVGSLQPAVLSAAQESSATVLFCSTRNSVTQFDSSEETLICLSAQALFNALQLCKPRENFTVTCSWACLQGNKAIDVLQSAVESDLKWKAETGALVETNAVPSCYMTNLMEVKMKTHREVQQLIHRVGQLSPEHHQWAKGGQGEGVGHSVFTLAVASQDGEVTGSVRFISIDVRQVEELAACIYAIETQQPSIPFHKSKLTLLLRDALSGKEKFAAVGTIDAKSDGKRMISEGNLEATKVVLLLINRLKRLFLLNPSDTGSAGDNRFLADFDIQEVERILSAYSVELSPDQISRLSRLVCDASLETNELSQIMLLLFRAVTNEAESAQRMKEECEVLRFKLKQVTQENNQLHEQEDSLRQELEAIKSKPQREEASWSKSFAEKKVLRNDQGHQPFANETKGDALDVRLKKALAEIADYEMYRDVMETTIIRMKSEFEQLRSKNNSFQQSVPKLKQRIQREQNARKIIEAKMKEMKQDAEDSKQLMSQLEQKLAEEQEANKRLQRKLKAKTAENQRQMLQHSAQQEQILEIQKRIESERTATANNIARLESDLDKARKATKVKHMDFLQVQREKQKQPKWKDEAEEKADLSMEMESEEEKSEASFTSGLVQGLKNKRRKNQRRLSSSRARTGASFSAKNKEHFQPRYQQRNTFIEQAR